MTIRPSTWMLIGFSGIVVYLMYSSARRTGGAPAAGPELAPAPQGGSPYMPTAGPAPATTFTQTPAPAPTAAQPASASDAQALADQQAFLQGLSGASTPFPTGG